MSKEQLPPAVSGKAYRMRRLSDPATAAAYINAAASNNDPNTLLQALRNVTEAHDNMNKVAERTSLNQQQLYRTLSSEGNPELRSFARILNATGLQFIVTAKPARGARKRVAA